MEFGTSRGTVIEKRVLHVAPYSGTHILGKSKSDKHTLISNLFLDSIHSGCALFDAYGTVADTVLQRIPEERWDDVVLVRPYDSWPVTFNPFYAVPKDDRSRVTKQFLTDLKSIYGYTNIATPTFDDYLTYSTAAILESNEPTVLALMKFFSSATFRARVLRQVDDKIVRRFWEQDFDQLSDRLKQEGTQSTVTKLRALALDRATRYTLGNYTPKLRFEDIADKILIVDLSIGKLGTETTRLLGSLMMAELYQHLLGRDTPYYCFTNGCRYFAPHTMVQMLDSPEECRAAYFFVYSYLDELDPALKNAFLGAADTTVAFRTGVLDSERLGPLMPQCDFTLAELAPAMALVQTPTEGCRVLIDEIRYPKIDGANQIANRSREKYGSDPNVLEQQIARFMRGK